MLYDTDLRLRPNGASGLLVSTVEAFEHYQQTQAWIWEHQALTRARYCAGDVEIGASFERIRHEVLARPRDSQALKKEVLEMRQKMLDAHPNASGQFDLKHDRGGIIDVEFAVQYLVLAHPHAHPELTRNDGNLALLAIAAELGLITPELAEASRDAYRHFRQWQHALRLQGAQYARITPEQAAPFVTGVRQLWQAVLGEN